MIHWSTVIYIVVMILLIIWWIRDYINEHSGGGLFGGGVKYGSGGEGYVAFVLAIFFTLIWGGIFWW